MASTQKNNAQMNETKNNICIHCAVKMNGYHIILRNSSSKGGDLAIDVWRWKMKKEMEVMEAKVEEGEQKAEEQKK